MKRFVDPRYLALAISSLALPSLTRSRWDPDSPLALESLLPFSSDSEDVSSSQETEDAGNDPLSLHQRSTTEEHHALLQPDGTQSTGAWAAEDKN